MNSVVLIGRLTRDPEVRYTQDQMAIARFSVAIDRPVTAGKEKQTDFPNVVVFGKQAENCERFLSKGRQEAILTRTATRFTQLRLLPTELNSLNGETGHQAERHRQDRMMTFLRALRLLKMKISHSKL